MLDGDRSYILIMTAIKSSHKRIILYQIIHGKVGRSSVDDWAMGAAANEEAKRDRFNTHL